MQSLTGWQKRQLRATASTMPVGVLIGTNGVTDTVLKTVEEYLQAHELVKIKFNEHKEEKAALTAEISEKSHSIIAGTIGHTAILYRQQEDPAKRKIVFVRHPDKSEE